MPVVGLASDWRLQLEGELMLALVRHGTKPHLGDLSFIAGALFNDRTATNESRANEVIEFLMKRGSLKSTPDHYLVEGDAGDMPGNGSLEEVAPSKATA
jgi:hypothetical protein